MKTLITAMALATCASLLPLQAQDTVTSVNAVGMVRITVPGNGGLVLARYDFVDPNSQTVNLAENIGTAVPVGTVLYIWNRADQSWVSPAPVLGEDIFTGDRFWAGGSPIINSGDAFFIKSPVGSNDFDVVFSGEVPGTANNSDSITLNNVSGFIGYPFPVAVEWASTVIADELPTGSVLIRWNPISQQYVVPGPTKSLDIFTGETSWSANPVINPGEGFWISVSGSPPPSVSEIKPYVWP